MSERRFTAPLDPRLDLGEAPERFGGKGTNLARMSALGVPLVPAVGVSVEAFWTFLESAGVGPILERLTEALAAGAEAESVRETLAEIRAQITATPLPEPIAGELEGGVESWREIAPEARTIVRSSATVEDSASHSFAGIFESTPTPGPGLDGLHDTVREIWSSVFSERALAYFRHAGLDAIPGMGLILQPFVEAERSGVLFTRFPDPSGEPRLLIEHVEGDCAKLVTGEVDPERAWIERWPSSAADLAEHPGLDPIDAGSAFELVTAARTLEERLGGPQDVEWCFAGGELAILQTRPITTLAGDDREGTAEVAAPSSAEVVVQGLGASRGAASGPAHLVFNIADADALAAGDVLVTAMTNPDMVAAMQRSSAVVTDVGGMICHAAIVSRELGIPCIVGTGSATERLAPGDVVTVDGTNGAVYAGALEIDGGASDPEIDWDSLWEGWRDTAGERGWLPLLHSVHALAGARPASEVVLSPYLDLVRDASGHARRLDSLTDRDLSAYLSDVVERAEAAGVVGVFIAPIGLTELSPRLEEAAARHGAIEWLTLEEGVDRTAARIRATTRSGGSISLWLRPERGPRDESAAGPGEVRHAVGLATAAWLDSPPPPRRADGEAEGGGAVFGTPPGMRIATMPSPESRARWHARLPEHARAMVGTSASPDSELDQEFEWLDVRPEVAITPFLSSLVLPGVETIPQALGFDRLQPLHTKWIRCRFHFRKDAFFPLFMQLMQATWREPFLSRVIERTRASYVALEQAAAAFPQGRALREAPAAELEARFVEWWRAFVDFFAFSFFIQAQGDDFVFPEIARAVSEHDEMARRYELFPGRSLPDAAAFTAPTRPVQTAAYMADLGRVWQALDEAGLRETGFAGIDSIVEAIEGGTAPAAVVEAVEAHLRDWGWMRERDPFFAPYDRPRDVVEKALGVQAGAAPDPDDHLRRDRLAAAVHFELAHAEGDPERFAYALRYNRELVLERENHHIAWLRHSYPVRRVWLEWERRLAEAAPLRERDIFFFKVPEALDAVAALPAPPDAELLTTVRNRRAAYEFEMRLSDPAQTGEIRREDDYY